MGRSKGVVSEAEWNSGSAAAGSAEKGSAILEALAKAERGGMTMARIRVETGIKWPYGTVVALHKAGTLERKKIGKANYYRVKVARKRQ